MYGGLDAVVACATLESIRRRRRPDQLRSGNSRYFQPLTPNLTPRPPGTRGPCELEGGAWRNRAAALSLGVALRNCYSRIRWKWRAEIELTVYPPLNSWVPRRGCYFLPPYVFLPRVCFFLPRVCFLPRECLFCPSKNALFKRDRSIG